MWLSAGFSGFLQGAVICIVAAAVAVDLKSRRIPNALTIPASIAGLVVNMAMHGSSEGIWVAFTGLAIAMAPPLIFFMLGGMGGGDVKLLASIGAWLGPEGALSVLLYTALAGGVMSGVMVLAKRGGFAPLKGVKTDVMLLLMTGKRPPPRSDGRSIPYSAPIAIGVLATILLGGAP
jgi:prepilin peptidase CpaA